MNALLGCTQHASCGSCGMEQQLPSSYLLNKMQFSFIGKGADLLEKASPWGFGCWVFPTARLLWPNIVNYFHPWGACWWKSWGHTCDLLWTFGVKSLSAWSIAYNPWGTCRWRSWGLTCNLLQTSGVKSPSA
eukprot:1152791-Pelagomonas_calceolata.AAC.1